MLLVGNTLPANHPINTAGSGHTPGAAPQLRRPTVTVIVIMFYIAPWQFELYAVLSWFWDDVLQATQVDSAFYPPIATMLECHGVIMQQNHTDPLTELTALPRHLLVEFRDGFVLKETEWERGEKRKGRKKAEKAQSVTPMRTTD